MLEEKRFQTWCLFIDTMFVFRHDFPFATKQHNLCSIQTHVFIYLLVHYIMQTLTSILVFCKNAAILSLIMSRVRRNNNNVTFTPCCCMQLMRFKRYPCDIIVVFIMLQNPESLRFVADAISLNESGYVITLPGYSASIVLVSAGRILLY